MVSHELYNVINHWQAVTFPRQDLVGKMRHLVKEANEALQAAEEGDRQAIAEELADCILLATACACKAGILYGSLTAHIASKFERVRNQDFLENEDGTYSRVKAPWEKP